MAALKGLYPRVTESEDNWFPAVYTSYLSSDLNPKWIGRHWHHDGSFFGNFVLVFHPDLLKDFPFIVCNADMFGDCKNPNLSEEERKKLTLLSSSENKTFHHNTKIISDWINHRLDPSNKDSDTFKTIRQPRLNKKWRRLNKLLDQLFGKKNSTKRLSFLLLMKSFSITFL